jgi:hypothetical protein
MVTQLRTRREEDVERLESVLRNVESGVDQRELLRQLNEAKDRMRSELD